MTGDLCKSPTAKAGRSRPTCTFLTRLERKSAKTQASLDGLLVIDCAADGRALGVDIAHPDVMTLDRLNGVLAGRGQTPLAAQEFRPLTVA